MKKRLIYQISLILILLSGLYGFSMLSLENKATTAEKSINLTQIFKTTSEDAPVVYMTNQISPESLIEIYNTLGRSATGKVAVKLHSGEPGGHNFLSPDLIKDLVQLVDGTIVECNTAYGGSRSTTAMHKQVIEDHGFTAIADVEIMDENGYTSIPVTGGTHLAENFVGASFDDYDFYIILSHFKGHAMGGFGGAIKNMSIGLAASRGKSWIHSSGTATTGFIGDHNNFLESMAEAASSIADKLGEKIIYISVMNNLSVDCDCMSNPAEPTMHDIGILASLDPVALDQACVDLVYDAPDGQDLINRMESLDGIHTLEHAIYIGFGNREYNLVSIDQASASRVVKNENIEIYPNPAQKIISVPNSDQYDLVRLVDINGKIVSETKCNTNISVEGIQKGTYIVQFVKDGKTAATSQLIKK